jgi:hypothetical protein
MSFGITPVVRILNEAGDGFKLINLSDFNEDLYTLYEDVVEIAKGVVDHVIEAEAGVKVSAGKTDAKPPEGAGEPAKPPEGAGEPAKPPEGAGEPAKPPEGAGEPAKPPEGAGVGWGSQPPPAAASEAEKPAEAQPPAEAAAKATKAK